MSEPILVVGSSRTRYFFLLLAAIGFVVGGVFLVARGSGADAWVGWMSIAFFGAGIPLFARQLLDSKPRVILDDAGVFDRTLGVGAIPWSEIKGAYVKSVHGNSFVCLVLTDPDRWVRKLPAVQRKLVQTNEALGFQPLNINLSGTAVDPVLVLDIVLKKCSKAEQGPTGE